MEKIISISRNLAYWRNVMCDECGKSAFKRKVFGNGKSTILNLVLFSCFLNLIALEKCFCNQRAISLLVPFPFDSFLLDNIFSPHITGVKSNRWFSVHCSFYFPIFVFGNGENSVAKPRLLLAPERYAWPIGKSAFKEKSTVMENPQIKTKFCFFF